MLQITPELLLSIIKGGIDKDEIIAKLVERHPDIFLRLVHDDEDLLYQIQLSYCPPDGDGMLRKVSAIKRYRQLTGTDLRTAKAEVDKMISDGELTGK